MPNHCFHRWSDAPAIYLYLYPRLIHHEHFNGNLYLSGSQTLYRVNFNIMYIRGWNSKSVYRYSIRWKIVKNHYFLLTTTSSVFVWMEEFGWISTIFSSFLFKNSCFVLLKLLLLLLLTKVHVYAFKNVQHVLPAVAINLVLSSCLWRQKDGMDYSFLLKYTRNHYKFGSPAG